MLDGEGKVDGVEPRDPLIRFELVVGELKENKLGVGVDETDDKSKFPEVPTESPALELFLSPAFSDINSLGTPNDKMLLLELSDLKTEALPALAPSFSLTKEDANLNGDPASLFPFSVAVLAGIGNVALSPNLNVVGAEACRVGATLPSEVTAGTAFCSFVEVVTLFPNVKVGEEKTGSFCDGNFSPKPNIGATAAFGTSEKAIFSGLVVDSGSITVAVVLDGDAVGKEKMELFSVVTGISDFAWSFIFFISETVEGLA